MTMPQALDRAAARWGSQVALKMIEGSDLVELTWAQLRDSVASLRSGLGLAGLDAGGKVGIMLGNQIEFPLAWLGCIDAGAVTVPLNPKYTRREVEFVLEDAGATWLITTSECMSRLLRDGRIGPVAQDHVIIVDGVQGGTGPAFADLLAAPITERTHVAHVLDVVNIQFTSGTTGMPKGCLLTHQYWVEFGAYAGALFDDPQRLLADHPFYYMQNQAYFTMALAGGGALYITQGLSIRKFMGWLHDYRIDFAWLDDFLLDLPESVGDKELAIKKAPMAGLSGATHAAMEKRFELQLRDWYASTEAGNGTFVPWERTDLVGTPTIGLAWPTSESKIIGPDGEEVAAGEQGEMCLRGSGMMLGYHNRPEVNAELFLPGGWYRTGDIVTKTADGLHFYVGRIKDMVKRSGENISCAEVEHVIFGMPQVAEVGVVPVPDEFRGEEAKAVVVLKAGASLTPGEIDSWCREGLAAFKVPRYIEFRDALPMTASGKVAKSVLRAESEPLHAKVVDLRPSRAAS
ncbi:class I adenylate-forming enzyme family protein [Dactylosporangium sp. NPDC048998]|uniref:class I adenylate-forming enzyme family protein n=1 Tax=Dactylosporangium sp. NPDC048998 TaxID=3363976 RepID=UPI00371424FC